MRSDITPPSIQSPQARCLCRFDGKRNTNEATPKPVPPVAKADLPRKREGTLAGNLAAQNELSIPVKLDRVASQFRGIPFILSCGQHPAPHFVSFPARRQVSERRSLRRLVHRFPPAESGVCAIHLLCQGERASTICAAVWRDSQID